MPGDGALTGNNRRPWRQNRRRRCQSGSIAAAQKRGLDARVMDWAQARLAQEFDAVISTLP